MRRTSTSLEDRPLHGNRIVVVAGQSADDDLSRELTALGADVIELPTSRIEPPSDLRSFAELVQDAHCYDWIVFISPEGATAFFDLFYKIYDDAREIGGARIAAIGRATSERIRQFHLKVDTQLEGDADSMADDLNKDGSVENLRILVVRSETAQDLLPRKLSALGAIVDEGFAYRIVPETRVESAARRRFLEEGAHLITFTSPVTVEQFLALSIPWPQGMRIASIGPSTSAIIRDRGLAVAVEAQQQNVKGLLQAIRNLLLPQTGN